MFERFTKEAREAVTGAVHEAQEEGSREVDGMHLLALLFRAPSTGEVLTGLGVSGEELSSRVAKARRRGGMTESDAAALDELGIDVDRIVSRIEESHGEHALAGAGRKRGKALFGRVQLTADMKRMISQSLREAGTLGDRELAPRHLLLGLLNTRGPAADVLAGFDVDYLAVRRALS
jgi:ATP-dependent Clp protease ATP-binding subunit ClpA